MNWHDIFEYKDGNLIWKVRPANRVKVGDVAGCACPKGYVRISYKGTFYGAHRIVWEMHNGSIPEGFEIDHININPSDNRIDNLRLATHQENNFNKAATGFRLKNNKYQARIMVSGKEIVLGAFDCMLDARAAYLAARKVYFGEYA